MAAPELLEKGRDLDTAALAAAVERRRCRPPRPRPESGMVAAWPAAPAVRCAPCFALVVCCWCWWRPWVVTQFEI